MNLQPGEGGVRAWTGHVASMEWRSSSLVLGGTIWLEAQRRGTPVTWKAILESPVV